MAEQKKTLEITIRTVRVSRARSTRRRRRSGLCWRDCEGRPTRCLVRAGGHPQLLDTVTSPRSMPLTQ